MKLNSSLLKQDLYRILGVPKGASREVIRRRYRHLVRVSHPDRNPLDERTAALRMAEINVAAAVLLDPQRRADYDRHRRLEAEARRSTPPKARADGRSRGGQTPDFVAPVCDTWETRRARRGLGREQLRVLEKLRPWASRRLEALSLWHAEQPPRSQLAFLVATVMLAFFLIGAARPRPLWDPPNRAAKGTVPATYSG